RTAISLGAKKSLLIIVERPPTIYSSYDCIFQWQDSLKTAPPQRVTFVSRQTNPRGRAPRTISPNEPRLLLPLHPKRLTFDHHAILRLRRPDAHLAVEEIALDRVEAALARIPVTSR